MVKNMCVKINLEKGKVSHRLTIFLFNLFIICSMSCQKIVRIFLFHNHNFIDLCLKMSYMMFCPTNKPISNLKKALLHISNIEKQKAFHSLHS